MNLPPTLPPNPNPPPDPNPRPPRRDSVTSPDGTCSCFRRGGYTALPCCVRRQTAYTRTFALLLRAHRRQSHKLAFPTPIPPDLPMEGQLYHLEGQVLVAAFHEACVSGHCAGAERRGFYERCMMRGGLGASIEKQEERERVLLEKREARKRGAAASSVLRPWVGRGQAVVAPRPVGGVVRKMDLREPTGDLLHSVSSDGQHGEFVSWESRV
ncbi:hypothetical protein B0A55_00912 [Friedmanniomyces simplex]|uniref:Uncharacterized protein n=1 Tax=Friedmanniomyces simplex TaxID=329884 RepID=A0A4U0XZ21_9PEZI|nr:hypothetical protein B0A55_00912 [Friedmanniomyces simplex]